jgi:hypothetical protein
VTSILTCGPMIGSTANEDEPSARTAATTSTGLWMTVMVIFRLLMVGVGLTSIFEAAR